MELLKVNFMSVLLIAVSVGTSCSKNSGNFSLDKTVDERVEESLDWNKAHSVRTIQTESDSYSVFCMSDSHLGTTINIDRFFSSAIRSQASAVVMAGDLCSGREEDYKTLNQHVPLDISVPVFAVAGNHDMHYEGWDLFYSEFGSSTYLFIVNTPSDSDLYICLDTSQGTLGKLQYNWLKKVLTESRSNYRRCIVITHCNFFRPAQSESTIPLPEEVAALVELFTKHNVDIVISGHDHRRDDRVLGITRYIVMNPLEDSADNAGYFVLRVQNGTLLYSFVSLSE